MTGKWLMLVQYFKKGSKEDPGNYGLVSLMVQACKICESIT